MSDNMNRDPHGDPLREDRKKMIGHLRPHLLRALGVTEEEVGDAPVSETFPLPDGSFVELTAVRVDGELDTSVKIESGRVQVSPDVVIAHSVIHDMLGDSSICKETHYDAFDKDGNALSEAKLSELFGELVGPTHYRSDPLGIFDDESYLFGVLASLSPARGSDN